MDEVFGRENFVANVVWQKKFAPQNDAKFMDANHDHLLAFAKDKAKVIINLLPRSETMDARYKNPDNDARGLWTAGDSLRREYREYAYYEIITPSGRKVLPPPGSSWRFNKEELPRLIEENRLWFGKNGNGVPRIKRFLSDVKQGIIAQTIWPHTEAGNTQEAKKEAIQFNNQDIFDTPKPERLVKRILEIATNENDLVLDSFLGSGTTAAVAHKINRRYIGIEMGEHAKTHCAARLKKVIDGEQGGISKSVNWQGGGGFTFYQLGEALFTAAGEIHADVRFSELAAYLWFYETHTPWQNPDTLSPLLGVHNDTAYYLLYNGILKDTSYGGGNILTAELLACLPEYQGKKIIYGLGRYLSDPYLTELAIEFRAIPQHVPIETNHKRRAGR